MLEFVARTARRARNHPIVIMFAVVGTVSLGVANAGRAIEEVNRLWDKWVNVPLPLETTWHGTWKTRTGYKFDFAMQVYVQQDDSADGYITWQLLETPPGSFLSHRIGHEAKEFVSGYFDRAKEILEVKGVRVSDPTLLALDHYRLRIRSDGSFIGMTKYRGDWEAQASGSVIVVTQR